MEGSINIAISDIVILILFFFFVGTIGYFVSVKRPSAEQLFFAGRKLTWPIIGFSILASNISTLTILGLTADSYTHGVATSSYEWMAAFILVILAIFFAPIYIQNKIKTVPEYFGKRYGKKVRYYFSIISLIIGSTVNIAGPLYAGAVLINLFLPQISIFQACIGIGTFAGIYTSVGGLSAVVFTDFFQAILFIMISFIISFSLFAQHDFSLVEVFNSVPEGHLKMFRSIDDDYMPWLGMLTGVPVLGFYFWCTDQVIIQRVVAARDIQQARYGLFFGALLKLSILFIIIFPGLMAISIFPDIANANDLYAVLVRELIPAGVIGLILAGLIAAMMSSIDSSLNSTTTLIVYDFLLTGKKPLSDRKIVKLGRFIVIIVMLVSLLWTPIISRFDGIWAYAQSMLTYLVSPLVAILFLGMFWSKGNERNALTALIGGHILSFIIFYCSIFGFITWHFTISAGIIFMMTFLIYLLSVYFNQSIFKADDQLIFTKLVQEKYLNFGIFKVEVNLLIAVIILIIMFITILPYLIR